MAARPTRRAAHTTPTAECPCSLAAGARKAHLLPPARPNPAAAALHSAAHRQSIPQPTSGAVAVLRAPVLQAAHYSPQPAAGCCSLQVSPQRAAMIDCRRPPATRRQARRESERGTIYWLWMLTWL